MFKKLKQMAGSVDKNLLRNGLLGRGTIVDINQTNVSTGGDDAFSKPVCIFTVEVALDNVPAYNAPAGRRSRSRSFPGWSPVSPSARCG